VKIAIASDHAGYEMKEDLKKVLGERYEWFDLGTNSLDSVDYPDFGQKMGAVISGGQAERGILICGTGIGISIAANRHATVRAALCTSGTMARLAREHNDANVLVMGARIIGLEVATDCVDTFMTTAFEGGRHERRVEKLKRGL
jgi:ribose 5-phosphate isomerase B